MTPSRGDFDHLSEVLGLAIRVLTRYEKEKRTLKPHEKSLLGQLNTIVMRFSDMECHFDPNFVKEAAPFIESSSFRKIIDTDNLSKDDVNIKTSHVENKGDSIRKRIASSKLMKEILSRDEESHRLVQFAAHCTNATSKGRSELCMVIIDGIGALFDDLKGGMEGSSNVPDVRNRKIRIFLHLKSYDVLEDPINKEIIKFNRLPFCPSTVSMKQRRSICTPLEFAGLTEGDNDSTTRSSTLSDVSQDDFTEREMLRTAHIQKVNSSLCMSYSDAIQRCFERLQPTKCVDEHSDFFPLVHEGHTCLGVIVLAGFEDGLFKLPKFVNALGAIQCIATLSIACVNHIEDIEWQKTKSDGMLKMAQQLSSDNLASEELLSQSIINVAMDLCEADRCSVFICKGDVLQAYFSSVVGGKTMTVPKNAGIAGYVATTGRTVNIQDAYRDGRFNPKVDKATGYRTKSILSMPIKYEGEIVAVAQLVNKRPLIYQMSRRCNSLSGIRTDKGETDKRRGSKFDQEDKTWTMIERHLAPRTNSYSQH